MATPLKLFITVVGSLACSWIFWYLLIESVWLRVDYTLKVRHLQHLWGNGVKTIQLITFFVCWSPGIFSDLSCYIITALKDPYEQKGLGELRLTNPARRVAIKTPAQTAAIDKQAPEIAINKSAWGGALLFYGISYSLLDSSRSSSLLEVGSYLSWVQVGSSPSWHENGSQMSGANDCSFECFYLPSFLWTLFELPQWCHPSRAFLMMVTFSKLWWRQLPGPGFSFWYHFFCLYFILIDVSRLWLNFYFVTVTANQ